MPLIQAIDPASLPVVLCGPIVRRITRTRVSVWVALATGDQVRLTVFNPAGAPTQGPLVTPLRVGRSLWVAVLSAGGVTGGQFAAGTTYEYTVSSPAWPPARTPNWADLAIPPRARPSFAGLPADLAGLRVMHTSCRRPHANRRDALALGLAELQSSNRPQLLVLTGDQVYADDVATLAMARMRAIASSLVGIDETPVFGAAPALAGRQAASTAMGLTSGDAKDHAWTLGEFYGLYLLAWSEVLWTQPLPSLSSAAPGEVDPSLTQEVFDGESANLQLFLASMAAVRRVLANTPTLMVFDDHEVTDDWNLDHRWLRAVYGNPQGRRVVANGLLAYLLFQHWGNDPDRFAVQGTEESLALAAAAFAEPGGSPITPALETRLGLPVVPDPVPAGGYDARNLNTGVRYDVRLGPNEGYPARLVLLDERTARRFPAAEARAGRIAPAALDLQLPVPQGNAANVPTLLVAPAPVLGLHVIEHVIQPLLGLTEGGPAAFDFESWTAWRPGFEYLLARLNAWRRVVVLSGDVHFGFTSTLAYEVAGAPQATSAVQFTAGGAKHSVSLTLLLQLLGDAATKLGLIRTRTFRGYSVLTQAQRDSLESVPSGTLVYDDAADVLLGRVLREGLQEPAVFADDVATLYGLGPADWTYTIESIDDERLPAAGNLVAAIAATPASWTGFNRASSIATVRGLRASDLVRIGRVTVGLPQLAVVTFPAVPAGQPPRARQDLRIAQGAQEPGPVITTTTEAVLA